MTGNLSEREEDYLRGILEVLEQKGYARIRDIADEVSVRPPSVVEMMKKLDRKKLVVYEKYGGVTLTPKGREIAEVISKRHETFIGFLEIILVPEKIAVKDAHILEHQLDPRTILQFNRFVEFVTSSSEHPHFVSSWMKMFEKYCNENGREENSFLTYR